MLKDIKERRKERYEVLWTSYSMYMNREEIKEIIVNIFGDIDPTVEVTEETYLLDDVLDSMGILYLLSEVYRQLKIEIPMQEVTISNFSTLADILTLVEKYSVCES